MRDHRRLRAFELAHALALAVYEATRPFPADEKFGLVSQMRRAAVSVASNSGEGCGRHLDADDLRFLDTANGSARELAYQLSLAERLGFFADGDQRSVIDLADETNRVLSALVRAVRDKRADR